MLCAATYLFIQVYLCMLFRTKYKYKHIMWEFLQNCFKFLIDKNVMRNERVRVEMGLFNTWWYNNRFLHCVSTYLIRAYSALGMPEHIPRTWAQSCTKTFKSLMCFECLSTPCVTDLFECNPKSIQRAKKELFPGSFHIIKSIIQTRIRFKHDFVVAVPFSCAEKFLIKCYVMLCFAAFIMLREC